MQVKPHGKKMVAPIVIAVLFALYYAGFFVVLLLVPDLSLPVKLLAGLVPLAFIGVCVFVLRERIREIRSGEEDDLDRY